MGVVFAFGMSLSIVSSWSKSRSNDTSSISVCGEGGVGLFIVRICYNTGGCCSCLRFLFQYLTILSQYAVVDALFCCVLLGVCGGGGGFKVGGMKWWLFLLIHM